MDDQAVTVGELLGVLRTNWRAVALSGLGLSLAIGLIAILSGRSYTATGTFIPASGGSSAASGFAAQFGIALPVADPTQSPDFYADLLQSPEILRAVANASYEFRESGRRVRETLVARYGGSESTGPLREDAAMAKLRRKLTVDTDRRTGLVKLAVSTENPELSKGVADALLQEVNDFNLRRRQSQASAERIFTEERVNIAEAALRAAEDAAANFQASNRDVGSPRLRVEYDRLQRQVSTRQQIYIALEQALEKAKIDEVRASPVVTIVEHPTVPPRPNPRGALKKALIALILGCAAAAAVVFARQYVWPG